MREGNEGRVQEGGSAQERRAPPHSYHRRWVIWYEYHILVKSKVIREAVAECIYYHGVFIKSKSASGRFY